MEFFFFLVLSPVGISAGWSSGWLAAESVFLFELKVKKEKKNREEGGEDEGEEDEKAMEKAMTQEGAMISRSRPQARFTCSARRVPLDKREIKILIMTGQE